MALRHAEVSWEYPSSYLRNLIGSQVIMENGTGEGSDPSSFLSETIGSNVKVKLNSGVEYTGKKIRKYVSSFDLRL